jgi:hypothetical protein
MDCHFEEGDARPELVHGAGHFDIGGLFMLQALLELGDEVRVELVGVAQEAGVGARPRL